LTVVFHIYIIVYAQLTWHEAKRQATLEARGLDFADCDEVFSGPIHNFEDLRKPYPETRIISVGFLRGRMVVVVYAAAGQDNRRIISMRYANDREKSYYRTFFGA
jgi:uncharacterized DUF497 family protein